MPQKKKQNNQPPHIPGTFPPPTPGKENTTSSSSQANTSHTADPPPQQPPAPTKDKQPPDNPPPEAIHHSQLDDLLKTSSAQTTNTSAPIQPTFYKEDIQEDITNFIRDAQESTLMDTQLWNYFQETFLDHKAEDLRQIHQKTLAKLKTFLLQHGVFIPSTTPQGNQAFYCLAAVLEEEEPHTWTTEEIERQSTTIFNSALNPQGPTSQTYYQKILRSPSRSSQSSPFISNPNGSTESLLATQQSQNPHSQQDKSQLNQTSNPLSPLTVSSDQSTIRQQVHFDNTPKFIQSSTNSPANHE